MGSSARSPPGRGSDVQENPLTQAVPLWLKIVYSAFVAVVVPCYWVTYTPWNFLYFCDVALLVTLAGIWTESALLVSIPSVGILLEF